MKKMIKVRAKEGLKVHFPMSVKTSPGARVFILEGDAVVEVPRDDLFVSKRMRAGDLVEVKAKKKAPAPKESSE